MASDNVAALEVMQQQQQQQNLELAGAHLSATSPWTWWWFLVPAHSAAHWGQMLWSVGLVLLLQWKCLCLPSDRLHPVSFRSPVLRSGIRN